MKIGKANVDEIFGALNHQIRIHGGSYISLVICGGTALAALGLITRTTKDAMANPFLSITLVEPIRYISNFMQQ